MCNVMLTCKDELHSGQSDLAIFGQVALHGMAHSYTLAEWLRKTRVEHAQNCTVRVLPTSNTLCTQAHTYILYVRTYIQVTPWCVCVS